jgi:hypothetical protein
MTADASEYALFKVGVFRRIQGTREATFDNLRFWGPKLPELSIWSVRKRLRLTVCAHHEL